jgi:hypothetical protein
MNRLMKENLIEDRLHRTHLLITKQHNVAPLLLRKLRRKTMINKARLILITAIAAASIASPVAALAQSAYTSGSAASRAAAGYASPYGSGLYAYAPGQVYGRSTQGR